MIDDSNEFFFCLSFNIVVICLIVSYDYYNTIVDNDYDNVVCKIVKILDLILIIHNVFVIVQCGLIFVIMALCYGIFLKSHSNRLNYQLQHIASHCRKRNCQTISDEKYTLKPLLKQTIMFLEWIYHQHSYACYDLLYCYQEIWSNALFGYLLISIPFNVIAVITLSTEQLTLVEMIIQYMIIMIHALMTILSLFQFSNETKLINQPKFYLVPIIQSIVFIDRTTILLRSNYNHSITLRLKLKYDDLFNRLTNGRKYGPNVSTMGAITNMFIFNVMFIEFYFMR